MEIPIFKIRSSCAGKIMTDPRGKSKMQLYLESLDKLESLKKRLSDLKDKSCKTAVSIDKEQIPETEKLIAELELVKDDALFSDTCMGYMIEWILEKKYNRLKTFTSRFTDKGNITEQAGFQLIQEMVFDGAFLSKNQKPYYDDFKTGVPDVIHNKTVIDNKSSYTLFTFPIGETEIESKGYDYQLDVYMDLVGVEDSLLCFTLNDTPYSIIEDEIKNLAYRRYRDTMEVPDQEAYEIVKNHCFTLEGLRERKALYGNADTSDFVEIPKHKRIIAFPKKKNQDNIDRLHKRVLECREWINANWHKF